MDNPHKRNLIAISTALAIFYLGEGEIKGASTFLGTINLGNPAILVWGAWGFFVYALWQFWIAPQPIHKSYREEWIKRLRNDPKFAELVDTNIGGKISTDNVDVSKNILRRKFIHASTDHMKSVKTPQARWSFTLDRLCWKHMLKSAFTEITFSNRVLPYFFSVAAVIVAVVKSV